MSHYDLVIGLDQGSVNKVASALFNKQGLRDKLFSGSQSQDILGTPIKVTWNVQRAPTVSLNPPSSKDWKQAIKSDGSVQAPAEDAFTVHFSQLHLAQEQTGSNKLETTTALSVICQMTISNKKLFISPMAVIVDLSSATETDKLIYKSIVIPKVLEMAGTMLSGEQLPKINYQGLSTGEPSLAVGSGRLIAVANLEGQPTPSAPNPADFPEGTFYTLFSRNALQTIMNMGAKDIVGKSTSTSGSQGFGIGKASYNATIRIDSLSAKSAGNDLTQVDAQLKVSASASAGISLLIPFLGEVGQGVTTAANTVAKGATEAANTVAKGTVTAANTVAHGAEKAAGAVKHFFGHLF